MGERFFARLQLIQRNAWYKLNVTHNINRIGNEHLPFQLRPLGRGCRPHEHLATFERCIAFWNFP